MMLATETRVQVSILGYLFSDLKKAGVSYQLSVISYQFTEKTPHTPHPTPHFPTSPPPTTRYSRAGSRLPTPCFKTGLTTFAVSGS
ncbi:MAG: hypothetical protein ACKN87_06320 [Microcystis aeruginosa]